MLIELNHNQAAQTMYTSRKLMSQFCLKFVYKNLDTLRPHMYAPSNCHSRRSRDPKLDSVTSNNVQEVHKLVETLVVSVLPNSEQFRSDLGCFRTRLF